MIQRIQTIYLLLIVALTAATLFLPLALLQMGDQICTFDVTGLSTTTAQPELIYPTWALFVLTIAITIIASITIFLFRKRVLQIRLCIFNALLMVGFYALAAFFVWNIKGQIEITSMAMKIALSFPLISLILDYLAIRNIGADEALVRSLERLR